MVEVVVAVAIMVMIAATVTPSVIGALDRTRQDRGAASLTALDSAITRFRTTVGVYPRKLSYLSTQIVSSDTNSCGATFGATNAGRWANGGPFISRVIPATGMRVFIGKAQNNMVRTSVSGAVTLTIKVDSVRQEDYEALEAMIDTDGSASAGTIRWTGAGGIGVMDYVRSSAGC